MTVAVDDPMHYATTVTQMEKHCLVLMDERKMNWSLKADTKTVLLYPGNWTRIVDHVNP